MVVVAILVPVMMLHDLELLREHLLVVMDLVHQQVCRLWMQYQTFVAMLFAHQAVVKRVVQQEVET